MARLEGWLLGAGAVGIAVAYAACLPPERTLVVPADGGVGGSSMDDASADGLLKEDSAETGDGMAGKGGSPEDASEAEASIEAEAGPVLDACPDGTTDCGNCTVGRLDCDGNAANGCETDGMTDQKNCGACGHDCLGGKCQASTCQALLLAIDQAMPWGLAVDSQRVYWSNMTSGEILSLPLSGAASPTKLADKQSDPGDIAIDDSFVYWTNFSAGGAVTRVGKDGAAGGLKQVAAGTGPWGVTVDDTYVWFTNSDGSIRQVVKSGGSPTSPISVPGSNPKSITSDDTELFWTELDSGKVMKAPKVDPNSNKQEMAIDQVKPSSVVVDANFIYWVATGSYAQAQCSAADGKVMKVAKTGGTPITLVSGQACPTDLAVDGEHVYFVNQGTFLAQTYQYDGAVMRVPLSGGAAETVMVGQVVPYSIALEDKAVYWTSQGLGVNSGSVAKIVKK